MSPCGTDEMEFHARDLFLLCYAIGVVFMTNVPTDSQLHFRMRV